jgi:AraC-like DNA-binding protein
MADAGAPAKPYAASAERLRVKVLTYTADNIGGDLSCSALRQVAGLRNEGHFREVFAIAFGITPKAWVKFQRVEAAKALLETTSIGVGEIARMTGFCHAAHLVYTFRKVTGETPIEHRFRTAGVTTPEPTQMRLDRRRKRGLLVNQLRGAEREIIHAALIACEGNISRTARRLGIARRSMQMKLTEYGLRHAARGPQHHVLSNLSITADYWRAQTELCGLSIPLTDLILGRPNRPELEAWAGDMARWRKLTT